jgi:DNA-binding LytR/AlgR family response regulator
MLAYLRSFDKKLTGTRDGRTFVIDSADVLYFDTVDKRTFLYTQNDVLETPLRLYELEEQLAGGSFFRASKSVIINISKISSLRPELSGKIEVTLSNAEKLYVSRQYVPELKSKLGL